MNKQDIKIELVRIMKEEAEQELKQLVNSEKSSLSMGTDEHGRGENFYESDAEEVMQSNEYLSLTADKLRDKLEVLSQIPVRSVHEVASLGAIVKTNLETLFISTYSKPIKIEETLYQPVSTKSPIFQAMDGKRSSERFDFRGSTHQILEIF